MPIIERKLLRVPVVARKLDMPEAAVYRLLREGLLPLVRVGRAVRVDAEKLEQFIGGGGKREA